MRPSAHDLVLRLFTQPIWHTQHQTAKDHRSLTKKTRARDGKRKCTIRPLHQQHSGVPKRMTLAAPVKQRLQMKCHAALAKTQHRPLYPAISSFRDPLCDPKLGRRPTQPSIDRLQNLARQRSISAPQRPMARQRLWPHISTLRHGAGLHLEVQALLLQLKWPFANRH